MKFKVELHQSLNTKPGLIPSRDGPEIRIMADS